MPNRLLIVEREGKYTTSASAVLRSDQWRVETIDSVEDALAIIRIRAPQAVLIDASLGERRTADFARDVGDMPEGREVPIFVVAEPGSAAEAGSLPKVTILNAPLSAYSLKTALELAVAPSASDTGEPILSVEAFDSAFAGILAEPAPSAVPESSVKKGPTPQEMLLRDFPELAGAAVEVEPKAPPEPPPLGGAPAAPPERSEEPVPFAIDWQLGEALLPAEEEEPEVEVPEAGGIVEPGPEPMEAEAPESGMGSAEGEEGAGGIVEFEGIEEMEALEEVEEAPAAPPPEMGTETFLFSLDEIGAEEMGEEEAPIEKPAPPPSDAGGREEGPEEDEEAASWLVPETGEAVVFEDRASASGEDEGGEEFALEPTSLSFGADLGKPGAASGGADLDEAAAGGGAGSESENTWTWEEPPSVGIEPSVAEGSPDIPVEEKTDWAKSLALGFDEEGGTPEASPGAVPEAASAPAENLETEGAAPEPSQQFEFTSWRDEESGGPEAAPLAAEPATTEGLIAFDFDEAEGSLPAVAASVEAEESIDDALVAMESFHPDFPSPAEADPRESFETEPSVAEEAVAEEAVAEETSLDFKEPREESGPALVEEGASKSVLEPLLPEPDEDLWAVGPEAEPVSTAAPQAAPLEEAGGDYARIETLIRAKVQEAVMEMIPAVTERILAETVEEMRRPAESD